MAAYLFARESLMGFKSCQVFCEALENHQTASGGDFGRLLYGPGGASNPDGAVISCVSEGPFDTLAYASFDRRNVDWMQWIGLWRCGAGLG
jgi:hypothetical protein